MDKWKAKLSEDEYKVLREGYTEPAYSGKYVDFNNDGMFRCKACGQKLFDSGTKFKSGTGWPSFYDAIKGSIEFKDDDSMGMNRTEVKCSKCHSHLGHVFDDGPDPTGKRFCVNSKALEFEDDS